MKYEDQTIKPKNYDQNFKNVKIYCAHEVCMYRERQK